MLGKRSLSRNVAANHAGQCRFLPTPVPSRRGLSVRSHLAVGGICIGCGGNHSRHALKVLLGRTATRTSAAVQRRSGLSTAHPRRKSVHGSEPRRLPGVVFARRRIVQGFFQLLRQAKAINRRAVEGMRRREAALAVGGR